MKAKALAWRRSKASQRFQKSPLEPVVLHDTHSRFSIFLLFKGYPALFSCFCQASAHVRPFCRPSFVEGPGQHLLNENLPEPPQDTSKHNCKSIKAHLQCFGFLPTIAVGNKVEDLRNFQPYQASGGRVGRAQFTPPRSPAKAKALA